MKTTNKQVTTVAAWSYLIIYTVELLRNRLYAPLLMLACKIATFKLRQTIDVPDVVTRVVALNNNTWLLNTTSLVLALLG